MVHMSRSESGVFVDHRNLTVFIKNRWILVYLNGNLETIYKAQERCLLSDFRNLC